MQHRDPHTFDRPLLLLSDVYPFISGDDEAAFRRARITMKLACLLHEKSTLAGSMVLEKPFLRNLVLSQQGFLKSGALVLDLRDECQSFNRLADIKFGPSVPDDLRRAADILDSVCKEVVIFSPSTTSHQYVSELRECLVDLHRRARCPNVRSSLEKGIERLDTLSGTLRYEDAAKLVDDTYIRRKVGNLAKLLYATIGARVTHSVPLLPVSVWRAADTSWVENRGEMSDRTDRVIADGAVMEYFAVDAMAIDRLSPEEIVDLRNEPLTSAYIRELDEASEQGRREFETRGCADRELVSLVKERQELIRQQVYKRCESERRHQGREGKIIHVVEEVGGTVVPFVATGKKVLAKLARTAASRHERLAWLDYTTTPISAYVTRHQERLMRRVLRG